MTHSHDTPTPAMSTETVPSEEFVLVPREPTPAMVDAGRIYGWDDPEHEASCIGHPETREAIYRAMIAAAPILSASHLAKEGGEAGAVEAEVERLSKVYAEATGYYAPFHAGLHSESSNRISTGIKAVLAAAPQPSPALAKGGDAVREALEAAARALETAAGRFNMMGGVGLVNGSDPKVGYSEAYEAARKARAALSTPTEGPASQTEGVGGDALRDTIARAITNMGQEEFREWAANHSTYPNAYKSTVDQVFTQTDRIIAALTPPETAEAVPVGPFVVMSANYSRPFMLGCYDTLNQAVMAQCGSPEKWHVFSRHPVSDPEAARLREELARVTRELEEETALRVGAIDRMKDAESERDEAVKEARAATASDPAPATDDRERLVEALAPADRAVQSLGALISTRPHSADRDLRDRYFEWMQSVQRAHADIRDALNVARAAFATEASR